MFLQTAFLKEKEENNVRVGGDGPGKRNGGKDNQQVHYQSFRLYGEDSFLRYRQRST